MLGFRPVRLNAKSSSRRRLEASSAGRMTTAPPKTAPSDNVSALGATVFPEVAWLFAVLTLPPRLDERGLRECLRQVERRFHNQRVPDSYVAGVRQAAALLVAGAWQSGMEAVPLLDIDQHLVLSNELLNVNARWLLEGVHQSLPWLKLTSRSMSGLTDAELDHLGCVRARATVLERLPPGFCPESLACCEAEHVVTLIRSEAFLEGLSRLLVHCGLSKQLSPQELTFLSSLEVTLVRELPLRLMYQGLDVTRPDRASSLHHLASNIVYLCNRDAAPFSKLLPAIAFRLRQGLGLASGGPPVSLWQRFLVTMLCQDDPAKIPGLVDDMINSDSPERVRSPKRRGCTSSESTSASKANTGPHAIETELGGVCFLGKLGEVAEDARETWEHLSPSRGETAERLGANVSWSVDPADSEGD